MNRILLATSLVALTFLVSQNAADAAVVPNANASVEGNINNRFPLFVNGGMRYQQVYDDSQFGSFATGGEFITGLAIRPDSTSRGVFGPKTISNLTIILSTTSTEPDALSTIFANNVGGDNTVVLSGSTTISSSNLPGPGNTRAFDVVIQFDTPFFYDPAGGNLLLDILNADASNNNIGIFFDAVNQNSDSVSRTWGTPLASSGSADSAGLVTEFITHPIPEPSSLALAGLGLSLIAMRRKR